MPISVGGVPTVEILSSSGFTVALHSLHSCSRSSTKATCRASVSSTACRKPSEQVAPPSPPPTKREKRWWYVSELQDKVSRVGVSNSSIRNSAGVPWTTAVQLNFT